MSAVDRVLRQLIIEQVEECEDEELLDLILKLLLQG